MSDVTARARVRLRFSKLGKVRFTSHRDTARIWERALRRAGVPVAYTEGFSPRPRVSFGLALPTGHESLGEYLDVDLAASAVDLEGLSARLDPALPAGFAVQGAAVVAPGTPSLQEAVTSCVWRLEVVDADPERIGTAVERALDDDHLVVTRERKGRQVTDDLRPSLLALALVGATPAGVELCAELATQPRAMRPSDVVAALAGDADDAASPWRLGRAARIHQFIGASDDRCEPLPSPPDVAGWSLAPRAPSPVEVCAS